VKNYDYLKISCKMYRRQRSWNALGYTSMYIESGLKKATKSFRMDSFHVGFESEVFWILNRRLNSRLLLLLQLK
jgi:hypothetical protein